MLQLNNSWAFPKYSVITCVYILLAGRSNASNTQRKHSMSDTEEAAPEVATPAPVVVEYDPLTGVPSEYNEYLPSDCIEYKRWKAAQEGPEALEKLTLKDKDGNEIEKQLPGANNRCAPPVANGGQQQRFSTATERSMRQCTCLVLRDEPHRIDAAFVCVAVDHHLRGSTWQVVYVALHSSYLPPVLISTIASNCAGRAFASMVPAFGLLHRTRFDLLAISADALLLTWLDRWFASAATLTDYQQHRGSVLHRRQDEEEGEGVHPAGDEHAQQEEEQHQRDGARQVWRQAFRCCQGVRQEVRHRRVGQQDRRRQGADRHAGRLCWAPGRAHSQNVWRLQQHYQGPHIPRCGEEEGAVL